MVVYTNFHLTIHLMNLPSSTNLNLKVKAIADQIKKMQNELLDHLIKVSMQYVAAINKRMTQQGDLSGRAGHGTIRKNRFHRQKKKIIGQCQIANELQIMLILSNCHLI